MTPAINLARQHRVSHQVHEYAHDPAAASYGLEAAEKLGLSPAQVFKTLVVQIDGKALVVAVIPVAEMLSMKQIARAAGGKKAEMANKADVERSSGYVLGGVSPLGQKRRLATFIDTSAQPLQTIFVSAGRRGLEIELAPSDLAALTNAGFADLTQQGG